MSDKTVAQKGHVKPGTRIAVLDPVPGVVETLGLEDPHFVDPGEAALVFIFVQSCAQLDEALPAAVAALAPGAAVWAFFRKGSKAAGLDVNRDDIWAVAEGLGLRPLGLVGVDDTWAAFRLRPGT